MRQAQNNKPYFFSRRTSLFHVKWSVTAKNNSIIDPLTRAKWIRVKLFQRPFILICAIFHSIAHGCVPTNKTQENPSSSWVIFSGEKDTNDSKTDQRTLRVLWPVVEHRSSSHHKEWLLLFLTTQLSTSLSRFPFSKPKGKDSSPRKETHFIPTTRSEQIPNSRYNPRPNPDSVAKSTATLFSRQ